MPFTISHAAAVLPFKNACPKTLSMPALVVGSMSPDFAYWLNVYYLSGLSHSMIGIFEFCLPLGLVCLTILYFLRHGFETWFALPRDYFCRQSFADVCKTRWLAIILSLIIGAMTHIAWDSFTHRTGFTVELMPGVLVPHVSLFGLSLPLYKWLQYVSGAVGLAIVAAYVAAVHGKNFGDGSKRRTIIFVTACGVFSLVLDLIFNLHETPQKFAFNFAVDMLRATSIAGCAYALYLEKTHVGKIES